jgi:hypothetical protein
MREATAFAAAATLIAVAFACCTYERWLRRRKRHELAWTAAMLLFAAGAGAFWWATANGWSPWSFRLFYLTGGVLTVPVLALGTVYLLGGVRLGDRVALAVALVGAYAAGVVATAPLRRPLDPDRLNEGREVFGAAPRVLAAVGSGLGATVVIVGAVWSAQRLVRARAATTGEAGTGVAAGGAPGASRGRSGLAPRRLALANGLIALGTLLISFKRPFVAVSGSDETGFALALAMGLAVIFGGFLLTAARPAPSPRPLHRPGLEGAVPLA